MGFSHVARMPQRTGVHGSHEGGLAFFRLPPLRFMLRPVPRLGQLPQRRLDCRFVFVAAQFAGELLEAVVLRRVTHFDTVRRLH